VLPLVLAGVAVVVCTVVAVGMGAGGAWQVASFHNTWRSS